MRQSLTRDRQTQIIWRDGEAFCVTQEFDKILGSHIPECLKYERMPAGRRNLEVRMPLSFPSYPGATLIFRRESFVLSWLRAWIQGKKLVSASIRQAGLILRHWGSGNSGTQVLAFGQRQPKPWCVESFILLQSAQPDPKGKSAETEPRLPLGRFQATDNVSTCLTDSLCPAGGEK